MKKLLTILTLLVAFVTQGWADTTITLFEGSQELDWNNSKQVVVENDLMKSVEIGSVITIQGTVSDGAQIQLCKNSPSWANIVSVNSNLSLPYSYTVTASDVDDIKASSLTIQGVNVTVTSVTMTIPSTYTAWEGSTALVWSGNATSSQSLNAAKFANIKVGSVIKLEGSVSSSPAITLSISYPWATVSKQLSAFPLQYVVTSGDLSSIKSNGMTVSGYDATLTKVTIDNSNPTITLPDNSLVLTGSNEYPTGNGLFSSLSVGDKIRVNFSKTDADDESYEPSIELRLTSGETDSKIAGNYNSSTDAEKTLYEIVVSDESSVTSIKTNGLFIAGNDITVGEITIIPAKQLTWFSEYELAASEFSSIEVGGTITITFANGTSPQIQIVSPIEGGNWSYSEGIDLTGTTYSIDVTSDNCDLIKQYGLKLKGNDATFVSVAVEAAPITQYAVTIGSVTGGTISVKNGETPINSGDEVDANTVLTLTAEPDDTHNFSNWVITAGGSTDETKTSLSDTYEVTADVTISATFAEIVVPAFSLDGFSPLVAESPKTTPTYNTTTHVFTTASDWTSIQLYIGNNSTYSGSKLVVKTQEEAKLRVTVYYVGEGNAASSYSTATKNHVVEIDSTKKIEKVIIDNTETGEVTLLSMVLDPTYTLTKTATTNGSFTVSTDGGTNTTEETSFAYGTTLTFTATANPSYVFSSWSDEATENPHNVVITEDLTIGATFEAAKTENDLNATATAMGNWTGYLTIAKEKFANASVNDVLKIYVQDVEDGAQISLKDQSENWPALEEATQYASLTGTVFTYTISTEDILTKLKTYGLVIGGQKYTYVKATLTTAGEVPEMVQYTLTVTAENGTVAKSPLGTDNKFDEGTTVTLTATPAEGYTFSKWTDGENDLTAESDGSLKVTMNSDKTVTAVFALADTRTEKTLLSGSVECGSDETETATIPGYKFKNAVAGDELVVKVSAVSADAAIVPKNPSTYDSYLGNAYQASIATDATEYRLELTADMITTLKTAGLRVYGKNLTIGNINLNTDGDLGTPTLYTLTTSATNGTIAVTPEATDGKYDEGTSLTLTATPAEGYTFSKWTIGETENTENPLTYTINSDVTITAVFEENAPATPVFDENGKMDLSKFISDGTAGYSYAEGKGTITTGEGETYTGVVVNLAEDDYVKGTKMIFKFQEATQAQIHVNYAGEEWKDGAQVTDTGTEIVVPLNATKNVNRIDIQIVNANTTAVLTEVAVSNKCKLTVTAANGTVAVKKSDETTTDTEFDYGTELTLTATPANSDYSFKQWVVGESTVTDNPYTFTMTGDTEITAEFKSADADVIWLGSQEINWNSGKLQTIAVTTDDNLKIADQLVFTITPNVEGIEWPQLQLSSKSEGTPVLIGSANTAIDETTTEVRYYVTKAMLNDITENGGFIVNGAVFTLSKVKIERYTGSEDYDNAIWIGEKTYPSGWSVYTTIGKDIFANATVGQTIRLKYKDVKTGAAMNFSYDDEGWQTLPDAARVTPSGLATKLTITEDMLTALKTGGLIISGVNFTLTSVDLLAVSDLKDLKGTVAVTGDDWVWTSSETPTFTLKVDNENGEAVTADAVLMIKTDKLADVTTLIKSQEIAANGSGEMTFTYKPENAGFYHATMILNEETVRAFYFGYAPTEIVSAADKQSDFDTFWSTAKTQLDAIDINATLTEIPSKSGSKRKVYLVEMQSVPDGTSGDPVTIRGYYAEPTDGKKHPVIVSFQGYDSEYRPAGQDATPYCMTGDDGNADYAEFILSTRGQCVNNRKASERIADGKGDFTNTYGDWFAYQFGNKDKYYYRGAYMDCVRAIQFMASRETSDMDNLFAQGQSQGGAFTYAAAALSGYTFKAIAPAITFMGDFPDYFQLTSWPANVAKENQGSMTDAQMYAFLSYFDTKNLATKIGCPVITSIGVQDNVCPPHTNIAPYNNVTTQADDKQIVFNAELMHATNGEWSTVYMDFFKKYMDYTPSSDAIIDEETGETDLTEMAAQDPETTTVTVNAEDNSITIETTEPYKAAQIWFDEPEEVKGNVLIVDIAEANADVTVTVKYTDGTESSMSSTTSEAAARRAAAAGTKISVPLEMGKEVQNIEVKNAKAGKITIQKMVVTTKNVFDADGNGDLSMMKPQSNATYDTATYTLAVTKGWTGATLTPLTTESVSGVELMVTFVTDASVKVAVTYTDGEGPNTIMEKAAKYVKLALDDTKKVKEIQIQPTAAGVVQFQSLSVNQSETPDPDYVAPLEENERRTLWESTEGEELNWNTICEKAANYGAILEEREQLEVYIASRVASEEWPKVLVRDAKSQDCGATIELAAIEEFPYMAKFKLTADMVEQLRDGFSICGSGIVVTKVCLYKPAALKPGDIDIADLNGGYQSSYDAQTHTITTTARWAARGWDIGDDRYNGYDVVFVQFEAVDFPVTLRMEYVDANGVTKTLSQGAPAGSTQVEIEIPDDVKIINYVYLMYQNPGTLTLTNAEVGFATDIHAVLSGGTMQPADDAWYQMDGKRVSKPGKGLYIHNGKKILVK